MAKFFGVVGFAGERKETSPGIWEETMVEYPYYGDIVRPSQSIQSGDAVNPDISLSSAVSIIADEYVNEHISAMRYVSLAGVLWKIVTVEPQRPRLLLRLGGVWSGRRASPQAP